MVGLVSPDPISTSTPGIGLPPLSPAGTSFAMRTHLHIDGSKLVAVTGGHVVSVETLMLRADADGRWAYRRAATVPAPGETPDEAARRISGVAAGDPGTVVHSTSWRYLPAGEVVLTYAVCPDPAPWPPAAEPAELTELAELAGLAELEIARGAAPATPSPERVEVAHVAAHAVRHLAFLLDNDPVVRAALLPHPEIAAALTARPGPGQRASYGPVPAARP
ncbi:hypothetical protein GCM10010149_48330 [Nonomuraea roseoviolacea subsp. roseoviolacea]